MTNLSEDAKAARRLYMKRWREANPDKVREYARRRWEKLAKESGGSDPADRGSGNPPTVLNEKTCGSKDGDQSGN